MSLDLQLNEKDMQTLTDTMKESDAYKDIQNKTRAGVLLCGQEMLNEVPNSQLEQFNKQPPNDADIEMALAIVNNYLKARGLNKTSTVLSEELPVKIFTDGEKKAKEFSKNFQQYDNLLSTVVAAVTD
ncbi:hypothetical protein TVAG_351890 [Trichomonas vaginalis G3]|uniref:LisH domain-containing protein n=1 Tax=Trichomonas vaginalis (strain ATCC PRA-98 / G3) TaxID=412133 RepID=A2DZS3_TRIV3|nr:hypothetical protein TVAGG3_0261460 [Trichomonas vaginalis G3]EAY14141.1 hypothetical protein TVAG_351890 [Trichomonas vaginalis G3]KAI5525151.1 hypothetical protein TVAGG3_0261460 [Trichomonas vaginalis G3]|eukprot:XP_001326364.1 hypothetical protein [Trichomonas vaginalis G3]